MKERLSIFQRNRLREAQTIYSFSRSCIFFLIILVSFSCDRKEKTGRQEHKAKEQSPDIRVPDFFKRKSQKPEVLLMGVFHFQDPGADGYKPDYAVDIFSEERQRELNNILDALSEYRPTQIIVEVNTQDQAWLDSTYNDYLAGNFQLRANEVFQIGFRLGRRLGIKELLAGDVQGRAYDYIASDWEGYKRKKEEIIESGNLLGRLDSDYGDRYQDFYSYLDSLKTTLSLKDYLLFLNEDSIISLCHGNYVLGGIGVNNGIEYPTVDRLSGWWYNRNLRIVSNIRKSIRDSNERVLVVFGNGHMSIIKHALEASPELNLVELKDVLDHDR